MKKIKQWWAELPPSRKEQFYIAIGFLIFGGLSLFLLSELIKQLKPIFPILINSLILLGCYFRILPTPKRFGKRTSTTASGSNGCYL